MTPCRPCVLYNQIAIRFLVFRNIPEMMFLSCESDFLYFLKQGVSSNKIEKSIFRIIEYIRFSFCRRKSFNLRLRRNGGDGYHVGWFLTLQRCPNHVLRCVTETRKRFLSDKRLHRRPNHIAVCINDSLRHLADLAAYRGASKNETDEVV